MNTHNAETYGTNLLSAFIGERFSYPKSLYAVHDTIRFFVANKPEALILDFFAGSGDNASCRQSFEQRRWRQSSLYNGYQ